MGTRARSVFGPRTCKLNYFNLFIEYNLHVVHTFFHFISLIQKSIVWLQWTIKCNPFRRSLTIFINLEKKEETKKKKKLKIFFLSLSLLLFFISTLSITERTQHLLRGVLETCWWLQNKLCNFCGYSVSISSLLL